MVFDFELQGKYSIMLIQKTKISIKVKEVLNKGSGDGFILPMLLRYSIFWVL
jgi:hypothetical protein